MEEEYNLEGLFPTQEELEAEFYGKPYKRFSNAIPDGLPISGIYKISNDTDNRIYIGSSKDIKTRWNSHIRNLIKGKHNDYFQSFYKKHLEISFHIDILENCNENLLKEREQYYLDLLQPFGKNGFNISRSSSYCPVTSDEKSKSHSYGICQYDFEGNLLRVFKSRAELVRGMGYPKTHINKACGGKLNTYMGFIWKYANQGIKDKLDPSEIIIPTRPKKAIIGMTEQGEEIARYENALEYERKTGWDRKWIKKVCAKEIPYFKGLYWYLE